MLATISHSRSTEELSQQFSEDANQPSVKQNSPKRKISPQRTKETEKLSEVVDLGKRDRYGL